MNPQDSKKKLQQKQDVKNAISDYQGIEKNDDSLNTSVTEFANSSTVPEALIRAAVNVPDGVVRSLVWKYVKTINSILSKTLFYLGVELGSTNDDIVEQAKQATQKIGALSKISLQVLNDPEVKENVKQLAIELNNSVLRPFLEVSLVTVGELSPQIDRASDKLAGRVHNGVRKLTDAVGNGVLDGLGTVPYIGNILNATGTIANTLLGVQSVVDESVGAILDQTLETLTILQKIGGPGNKALDSWINFAINANAALKTAKNQWDKVSANFQAKTFIPDPILSKEALIAESEQRRQQRKELPVATEVKSNPNEATSKVPVATDVKPVKPQASKPVKSSKVGGRRKKRKKKTKKKNQKKRTKSKSRRRK